MSLLVESITDMCRYFLRLSGWPPVSHWFFLWTLDRTTYSNTGKFWLSGVLVQGCSPPGKWLDTKVDGGNEGTTKMFCFFSPQNDVQRFLLTPPCSSAVGSVSPCAWGRHTVQSCSSPGSWKNVMTGRCRSRYSTGGGRRTPLRAGPPGSSSRWSWPRWGPGCTARSCPSLRRWSPEALMMGMPCSTLGSVNLRQEKCSTFM